MQIVLCDDALCELDALASAVQRWMERSGHADVTLFSFTSSEELLSRWEQGFQIDMLFLDIQIPGELSGLELAKMIREKDDRVVIVFTTNYDDYVFDGYTVHALRYLKKPVAEAEVCACLDAAYRQTLSSQTASLILSSKNQHEIIRFREILYIESKLHYLYIYESQSAVPLKIRTKLSELMEKLPKQQFIQCHCSYVVNLSYIRRYTRDCVILASGKTIPVSRAFFSELHTAVRTFYGEV